MLWVVALVGLTAYLFQKAGHHLSRMTVMAERIFDEKTLRKLERLTLIANKIRSGAIKGERRSTRRGTSIEFADYRNYVRGDDLRRVDWNIYARLQRPFIKLLEDEEDLAVHLLLDASASMDWPRTGDRDLHKFLYAQRVLAGLAYIALGGGDQVTITVLRGDGVQRWGPLRGRGHTLNLLLWLEKAYTRGQVNLNQALGDYARRTARAGRVRGADRSALAGRVRGRACARCKGAATKSP